MMSLWIPIVVSAVLVFVVSSVVHMALTYHRSDYQRLPDEDQLRTAIRNSGAAPGDYMFPYTAGPQEMKSPEIMAKWTEGPVGIITLLPNGPPAMGKNLVTWFVFAVVMSLFAGYLAGRTLPAGAEYLAVFRVTGTVAFLGYGAGRAIESIWMGRPWGSTIKHMFDGLVYGLVTAGAFGWLWPDA